MLFKEAQDKAEWEGAIPLNLDVEKVAHLKQLISSIDLLSQACGLGEITITSFHRPVGHPLYRQGSYHSISQAADIRVHDKPPQFRLFMQHLKAAVSAGNPQLQIDMHEELRKTPSAHIHVEYDDGTLQTGQ